MPKRHKNGEDGPSRGKRVGGESWRSVATLPDGKVDRHETWNLDRCSAPGAVWRIGLLGCELHHVPTCFHDRGLRGGS